MKKILSTLLIFTMILNMTACSTYTNDTSVKDNDSVRIYEHDYKIISLNTEITTTYNDTEITISGDIFRLLVDPLTIKDSDGNVLGYAGDVYGFISQDDHGIYVDDNFEINMCGNIDFLGESYELKDSNGTVVGYAAFNMNSTRGEITDINGNLISKYSSKLLANDYTVTIYDNEVCSDMAILMIIASYVSDFQADRKK